MSGSGNGNGDGPVIRDKRRIDPDTGEVRAPKEEPADLEPEAEAESEQETGGAEGTELKAQLEELTGGFKSVGEALEALVGKLGLERFGEKGEPFDPTVHEALMHTYSAEVTETTCVDILQPGYRIGSRILRPARVAVAEPAEPAE